MISLLGMLFLLSVENSDLYNLSIRVNITDELSMADQWVYLFLADENEFFPLDSCYVSMDQQEFYLRGNLYKNDSFCWITFSEKGPVQLALTLDPGDEIEIDVLSNQGRQPVKGSLVNELKYSTHKSLVEAGKRIEEINTLLGQQESEQSMSIDDLQKELDSLKYEYEIGIDIRALEVTPSASDYKSTLHNRLKKHLPEEQFDEEIKKMKLKFPDDKKVQMYPDYEPASPPSERSKYWQTRFQEMFLHNLSNRNPGTTVVENLPPSEFLGDDFKDITLPDVEGFDRALSSLNSKYTLIDFWASWCIPCRREISHLKAALEEYKGEFTIYAISIDSDKNAWLKAIEKDGSEEFIHVFLGNYNPESEALLKKYEIKEIPVNFFIDSDGKIMATNLRGEQLSEKLSELLE